MNKNFEKEGMKIINEVFEEEREIMGFAPDEMTDIEDEDFQNPLIFITSEGELIILEVQITNFNEEELARHIELAEKLYYKNKVHISLYILCPKHIEVSAPICRIKSDADFTIKLACIEQNPTYEILSYLKKKVDMNMKLDDDDLKALSMIPMAGPREDRTYLRIECFKILNRAQKI